MIGKQALLLLASSLKRWIRLPQGNDGVVDLLFCLSCELLRLRQWSTKSTALPLRATLPARRCRRALVEA